MDKQFDDGLHMRKQVMGEAFVDAAFDNADEFTRPVTTLMVRNRNTHPPCNHSTVTDLAKFRGLSTSVPRANAV